MNPAPPNFVYWLSFPFDEYGSFVHMFRLFPLQRRRHNDEVTRDPFVVLRCSMGEWYCTLATYARCLLNSTGVADDTKVSPVYQKGLPSHVLRIGAGSGFYVWRRIKNIGWCMYSVCHDWWYAGQSRGLHGYRPCHKPQVGDRRSQTVLGLHGYIHEGPSLSICTYECVRPQYGSRNSPHGCFS